MSETVYYDYMLQFPVSGLAMALDAIAALVSAAMLDPGSLPDNMLGDFRDASGAALPSVSSEAPAWIGRPGRAGFTYQDPDTGQQVTVPPVGDPNCYYIHIRASVPPNELPFDPAAYGLTPSDPQESASVLGVWA